MYCKEAYTRIMDNLAELKNPEVNISALFLALILSYILSLALILSYTLFLVRIFDVPFYQVLENYKTMSKISEGVCSKNAPVQVRQLFPRFSIS